MSEWNEYEVCMDSSGFVNVSDIVPDVILEIRYYTTYNFIGDRIDGYEEPIALLTKEAAAALKIASDEFVKNGYRIKIFDAYRPQRAVDQFVLWARNPDDNRMKSIFYPHVEKRRLFSESYLCSYSGHTRGSSVDLTLFNMAKSHEADMGGYFDYLGKRSHSDYENITEDQHNNRMFLKNVMVKCGFEPSDEEWWHFTLKDEPYPETYFDFPVRLR